MSEIPMVRCFVAEAGSGAAPKADVAYVPLKDFVSWKTEMERSRHAAVLDEVFSIWLDVEEKAKYPHTFNRLGSDEVTEITVECFCEIHSICEAHYVPAGHSHSTRSSLPRKYRAMCINPKASRFGSRFKMRERSGFWIHPEHLSR
jgi:hypothetical protein